MKARCIRHLLMLYAWTTLAAGGSVVLASEQGTTLEIVTIVNSDGKSALRYASIRQIQPFKNISLPKGAYRQLEHFFPKDRKLNTNWLKQFDGVEFPPARAVSYIQRLQLGDSKDDRLDFAPSTGIHRYRWGTIALSEQNTQPGLFWTGGFQNLVFVWHLPAGFELVNRIADVSTGKGTWISNGSTATWYGEGVNHVQFDLSWKPKLQDLCKKIIDSQGSQVEVECGKQLRVVISDTELFSNNTVHFRTGSAELSKGGAQIIKGVVAVLGDEMSVAIEGHTDNDPILGGRFRSNWDLSTARALAVLRKMADLGIAQRRMRVTGFGEFKPRGDNSTVEGKARNRRIEIVVMRGDDLQCVPQFLQMC